MAKEKIEYIRRVKNLFCRKIVRIARPPNLPCVIAGKKQSTKSGWFGKAELIKTEHFINNPKPKGVNMKHITIISACAAVLFCGCLPTTTVIDFDDLSSISISGAPVTLGTHLPVGTIIEEEDSGIKLIVLPFKWIGTGWGDGYVEIVIGTMSGGTGNEVHFNNACLGIIMPENTTIKQMTIKFGDYGGNINLIENGTLHNYEDYTGIPSPTLSGVTVTVTGTLPIATLELKGTMGQFTYTFPTYTITPLPLYAAVIGGGQELWMDDIVLKQ